MIGKIFAYVIVYIVLIVIAIKIYLWGRRLQKEKQGKWKARFGLIFFCAPIVILLIDLCLPLPEGLKSALLFVVNIIDYTLAWIKAVMEPALGKFWYFVLRPVFSALVYGLFGFIFGSLFDMIGAKKQDSPPANKKKKKAKAKQNSTPKKKKKKAR